MTPLCPLGWTVWVLVCLCLLPSDFVAMADCCRLTFAGCVDAVPRTDGFRGWCCLPLAGCVGGAVSYVFVLAMYIGGLC